MWLVHACGRCTPPGAEARRGGEGVVRDREPGGSGPGDPSDPVESGGQRDAAGPTGRRPAAARGARLLVSVAVGVLVIAGLARWGADLAALLHDRARLEAWLSGFGPWAPLAAAAFVALKSILFVLPGQLLALANGWLSGFGLGALCTYAGMMGGTGIAMLLSRRFGRPLVQRLIPARGLRRVDDLAQRSGGPFFALVFLLPFTPDDLACWAIGLTPLPLGRMLAIAAVTRLPSALISAWLGAHASRLDRAGWIAAGVVVTLLLVGYVALRERIEAVVWGWLERAGGKPAAPGAGQPRGERGPGRGGPVS